MHTHHRNQQSRHENPIRKRHDALKRIGTNEPQSTGMKGLARQAIQDWRKYLTTKVLLRARETGCPKKSRDLVPTFEANPVVFQGCESESLFHHGHGRGMLDFGGIVAPGRVSD